VWSSPAAVRDCQLSAHGDLTVTERLATLLDTGQFADVTVRVGAGGQAASFKAHRLLLASASQPLYRLVSTVQAGHQDLSTLRVTDVPPGAFRNVLKYIYTDEVCIDSIMDAFELLKAGKKWNLQKMNGRTINYLDEYLESFTPDSEAKKNEIFNLLLLAKSHSEELFEKCLTVIVKFAGDIIPCEGFLSIDDKTIKRIFGHKDFAYEDQLKLFESIKDWGMNQILQKGLNPSRLHPTIEDLLNYVEFDKIEDKDFMGTILPSECLSRGEVISFFMSRGMNIPRDNMAASPATPEESEYEKVSRFKKGYRLPHKEIYQSHEARFMVEQNVRLLGVGFGFLFSNTDMGVTIHCQGPWERRQWTDITQTYCRVSHEQMTSANLRLMFAEPARLEAKLSYKVLVKITRMTAGSNDVELWGGKEGVGSIKKDDATFYFIKAAVNPNKEVEEREMDIKDGMITELLYVLDEDAPPAEPEPSTLHVRRRSEVPSAKEDTPPPKVEASPPTFMRKRPVNFEQSLTDCSATPTRRTFAATHTKWQPAGSSTSTASGIYPSGNKTPDAPETNKKPETSTTSTYLTRKRPTVTVDVKPAFLRSRVTTPTKTPDSPFGERLKTTSRPSWRTRTRPEEDTAVAPSQSSRTTMTNGHSHNDTSYASSRSSQEKSNTSNPYGKGSSASKDLGSNTTSSVTRDSTSYSSRYGRAPSSSKESSLTSSGYSSSRYSRDSSLSKDKTDNNSSLYPKSSTSLSRSESARQSVRPSRYSTESNSSRPDTDKSTSSSRFSRDVDSSASRFGGDRDTSATRYGRERESSTTRYGRERESSTSRYGRERESSTSRLGKDREPSSSISYGTSRDSTSRFGTDMNSLHSKYGTGTNTTGSRFGRDTNASTNRFGTQVGSLSSKYGNSTSSSTSSYGNDSKSSVNRFGKTATPYTSTYNTDAKNSTTQYGSDKTTSTNATETEKKPLGKYSSRVRDLSATRYGSYGSSPYTSGTYGSGYSPSKYLSSYVSKYR